MSSSLTYLYISPKQVVRMLLPVLLVLSMSLAWGGVHLMMSDITHEANNRDSVSSNVQPVTAKIHIVSGTIITNLKESSSLEIVYIHKKQNVGKKSSQKKKKKVAQVVPKRVDLEKENKSEINNTKTIIFPLSGSQAIFTGKKHSDSILPPSNYKFKRIKDILFMVVSLSFGNSSRDINFIYELSENTGIFEGSSIFVRPPPKKI